MKIFPAIILSGVLLVAAIAAGVSGHSLKSRASATSELSTEGVRPLLATGSAGTELADPAQSGADEYATWMALHAIQ